MGSLLVTQASTLGTANSSNTNQFGKGWDGGTFGGIIDSNRLYSRALTASEILANYQAGNIEFQTRTSADNSTWEAWKPTTSEAALDSLDSLSPVEKISQTSLIAYWKLDETSGTRADSKGSNTLTDNNTVTYAPGRLSNAAQFTAANSEYLSIADNADVSTGDVDFTLAAWVNADSLSNYMTIIGKYNGVGDQREIGSLQYHFATNRFNINLYNGVSSIGSVSANSLGAPSANTWYYIVAWHDSVANTINIQVNNGAVDSAATTGAPIDGTAPLQIGAENGANPWNGKIDELAFWKRTLTAAERTQLFEDGLDLHAAGSGRIYRSRDTTTKIEGTASEKLQLGSPQVDSSTVALWHLEETSGTGAYIKDATANANHGTPTGTTVVDGFYGKGRNFNGTSDKVSAGTDITNFEFGNGAFTVETWFKSTTGAGQWSNPIISYGTDTGAGSSWKIYAGQPIYGYIWQGGTSYDVTATSTTNDGKWHHVALERDGNTLKIFVDGKQEDTQDVTGITNNDAATANLTIGNDSSTNYFNGSIDEVRVTKGTARSAEEIAEAYRAGRDHRISKSLTSTDLTSKTKLPFYVASDRPGTYLEATVGESALLNNFAGDPDMKGYWPLDENSNGAAAVTRNDYSGNGNNLTDNNTTTSGQGKIGKAGDFESTNSENLSISDNASLSTGDIDFTFATWVKLESNNDTRAIVSKDDGITQREYLLGYHNANNNFIFYLLDNANLLAAAETPQGASSSVATDTWYFIVAWHNAANNTANIQINNGQVYSNSYVSGSIKDSTTAFKIGQAPNWQWDGLIDEVMFIKRVLTADERRQMFEIGKRTHPITIDFVSSPQAAYTSGTSVTINNPWGTTNLTDTLSVGDTMIFKENVGGTETVSQAAVTAITNTSSVYGTVTLDAAPTFPTGGYSTNAKVFKWQREYFDLTGSLATQRDAITRLTMRVTDGSQGANVWLDDFKSASYINRTTCDTLNTTTGECTYTIPAGSVTSTLNRYAQIRAIMSTWDTAVSPIFTSSQIEYGL